MEEEEDGGQSFAPVAKMLVGPAQNYVVLVQVGYNVEKQVAQRQLALPGYVKNTAEDIVVQMEWGWQVLGWGKECQSSLPQV